MVQYRRVLYGGGMMKRCRGVRPIYSLLNSPEAQSLGDEGPPAAPLGEFSVK